MNAKVLIRVLIALGVIAGAFLLSSADGPAFTEQSKAYYLSPAQADFIRPGLVIKITKAEIGADGTLKAWYKITDPKGIPLDRDGIYTPGAVSVSLIAARIPKGEPQYLAYTTRVQTSPITGASATQAGTDSGGRHDKIADGEYLYTFGVKLPAGFDRTVTHSIGAYGSRDLREFDLDRQFDDDVFSFVPDGSAVKTVRDVIRTATCNKCHHSMGFHGGSRKTMELCVLCHQPQTWDPDTVNTVDLPVMIHKIHMGANLPSVKKGKKYVIIGNAQSVNDYSKIVFPADARNCRACHETDKGATQAANVNRANRDACGACHDDVNFATGEGHVDLPQVTDSQCAGCHVPKGELEFDASIQGAHTIPNLSASLPGVVFQILAVDGAGPGKMPTVTFTVKDKAGKPIKIADMPRLNLRLAGPASDYTSFLVAEDVRKAEGATDGRYYWTFQTPLPADASGTFVVTMDGRQTMKLLEGTKKEVTATDAGENKFFYFSVDGSKVAPRRATVAPAKCNACHTALPLVIHGGSYSTTEMCVVCHYPARVSGTGAAAESVDFRTMIHKIHRGAGLTRGYKIGANYDFSNVGYPGILKNCTACHVNNGEQLPVKGVLPASNPKGPVNPLPPTAAACLACHDTVAAASHALANTTKQGESCVTCHGPSADFSVNKVHAW
ncbi:MAG: OmcA/MtrC family decaheme c-type cytochrome [Acidobacteria bacterium]|nr:OmcA/MtrC family decaheme c-type cytochrome [Acidobacteriota bacterium]